MEISTFALRKTGKESGMSAEINNSVILHEGKVFKLLRENVTLKNGVTVDLDIIHQSPPMSLMHRVRATSKLLCLG